MNQGAKKYPKFILIVCAVSLSFFLFFLGMELLLRAVMSYPPDVLFDHERDALLGWKNPSGVTRVSTNPSFHVVVRTNSFGMRDRPRQMARDEHLRVAFLGDSYTQAIQVEDEEVFNRLIEKARSDIEALNFGVSGYGTVQELLQYRTQVKRFSPDVVVVMFWPFNDPFDNSMDLQRYMGSREDEVQLRPFLVPRMQGGLTLLKPVLPFMPPVWFSLKNWLREKLWTVAAALKLKNMAKQTIYGIFKKEENVGQKKTINMEEASSVADERLDDPMWLKAWVLTFRIIDLLRIEVEADGARLVVASLPVEPINKDKPWNEITRVEKKLQEELVKLNIAFLPLTPCFRRYLQTNEFQPPHFHYESGDGHWSPLGHRVAAACLLEGLGEVGSIPVKRNPLVG